MNSSISQFLDTLRPTGQVERKDIHLNGARLPIKSKLREGASSLLVSFHGAVDRAARDIPFFNPILPNLGDEISQVSISDPSMILEGNFSMAWYAGHEGFPCQSALTDFIRAFTDHLGFKRVVFFGSSGGGFASLFYSSRVSGSIAIAGVPQTNMRKYYAGHVKRYREACWPSLTLDEQLSDVICTDLCKWYEVPRDNTVIYMQSAGDHFHTRTQFAPFLHSISKVKTSRFIAHSGFWGRLGHSGAITPDCYLPWVRAAFSSPTIEVDDLLLAHEAMSRTNEHRETSPKSSRDIVDSRDIRMARLLRDYHLGGAKNG